MRGFMSRRAPNGWSISSISQNGQFGKLPVNSELFEVLRQGADLLMSPAASGFICGKEFTVRRTRLGARQISIPIVGTTWILTTNTRSSVKSEIMLFMTNDFVYPEDKPRDTDEQYAEEEDIYDESY